MIYGFLDSQSVLLSNIGRSLKENNLLKKTVERLSRNLDNFDEQEDLIEKNINELKSYIDDNTVFCCDKSDVVKPYSKKLEALDFVEEHFGKKGIYALDRGYDANMYYEYFTEDNNDYH
ncbi:MAG: hypothetical protein ACQERL_11355 [Bacillota bacterium]